MEDNIKEQTEPKVDPCFEWAINHKIGTTWQGLTISQYVQDEEGRVYVAIPLEDIIKKDAE